jgi:biotin synthase-like enzyme
MVALCLQDLSACIWTKLNNISVIKSPRWDKQLCNLMYDAESVRQQIFENMQVMLRKFLYMRTMCKLFTVLSETEPFQFGMVLQI